MCFDMVRLSSGDFLQTYSYQGFTSVSTKSTQITIRLLKTQANFTYAVDNGAVTPTNTCHKVNSVELKFL